MAVAYYAGSDLTQTGTIATMTDGSGRQTLVSSWKRGVPQSIVHPVLAGQPVEKESAVVNDDGTLASVTNEAGSKTCYEYDPMGRLAGITYPSETQAGICDTSSYSKTTLSFKGGYPEALGVPAGHWRQTVQTGQGRKIILFDAMWRPLVEQDIDLTDVNGARTEVAKRYDMAGRLAFQSYPMFTVGSYADPALKGTKTEYDSLDRVTAVRQDWEDSAITGSLLTKTEYLAGLETRVTDPKGNVTQTRNIAYDDPSTAWPDRIVHPGGAYTYLQRDTFGKLTALIRQNSTGSTAVTRSYFYNAAQELCKTVEPETGTVLFRYDGVGNMVRRETIPLQSPTVCQTTLADSGGRNAPTGGASSPPQQAPAVLFSYDARNRLKTVDFSDNKGNQVWTYTPDGLPATITATNPNVASPTKTSYTYNRRRLLTRETLQPLGGATAWSVGYGYNANGHRSLIQYPSGLSVSLAPNALGQQKSAGVFASGVSYAPNGVVAGFTYGNGVLHQLTQNVRGLPERSLDIFSSTRYLDDSYDYDGNGNIAGISDGRDATQRRNVSMTYDNRDRLLTASSKMFSNTGAAGIIGYSYDVLDNLTRVNAPATSNSAARNHYYCYDTNNRLDFIRTGPACTGTASPAAITLTYDARGNVSGKNSIAYGFDIGNRLRTSPGMWYAYDALGRRVLSCTASACGYSLYGRDGQLLFTWDERDGKKTEYVYLGGSLVAEQSTPLSGGAQVVKYQHTDALGSPVAVTNSNRIIVASENAEYDPYGRLANNALSDGPGYTGHVSDAATGLSYMQQRYYDPSIQIFLSVDPVTALTSSFTSFHRYRYANNNPYRFVDPDGRAPGQPGTQNCAGSGISCPDSEISDEPKTPEVSSITKGGIGTRGEALGVQLRYRMNRYVEPSDIADTVNERVKSGFKPDDDRFTYTEDVGWIDFKHVVTAGKVPSGWTMGSIWEFSQSLVPSYSFSSGSSEDANSNVIGSNAAMWASGAPRAPGMTADFGNNVGAMVNSIRPLTYDQAKKRLQP